MSVSTTGPTTNWRRPQVTQGWLARLFDSKLFLIIACLTPALGLLLIFLTYPLGLGIWLAFTDTNIGPLLPRIEGGLFSFDHSPLPDGMVARRGKVFVQPAAGWMAGFSENQLFVIRFPHYDISMIHPAQGQVELYYLLLVQFRG